MLPAHFWFVSGAWKSRSSRLNGDLVFTHQPPDPPVPHIYPNVLESFGHSRSAIAAQAQTGLVLDVGQNDHVRALPAAGGAAVKGPQPARTDVHHPAQVLDRECPTVFFDEPEHHGFWLAKNTVVGSTGQRNGSFEGISRRLEAKCFPRFRVKPQGDLVEVTLCVNG